MKQQFRNLASLDLNDLDDLDDLNDFTFLNLHIIGPRIYPWLCTWRLCSANNGCVAAAGKDIFTVWVQIMYV